MINLPLDVTELLQQCDCNKEQSSKIECPLLCRFELTWDCDLKCIHPHSFDINHLIPGNYLWMYLHNHTAAFTGATKSNVPTTVIFHFVVCYPSIENQTTDMLRQSLPKSLLTALPYSESTVAEHYSCPYMDCSNVIKVTNEYIGGQKFHHEAEDLKKHKPIKRVYLSSIPKQWTQLIGIGPGKDKQEIYYFAVVRT